MGSTELPNSNHVRYLGVELDSKLSWKRHVLEKVKIAKFKLMHNVRALGKLWGPSPKITRWAYSSILRPALTCARCHVWSRAITDKSIASSLVRVNRLKALMYFLKRSNFKEGVVKKIAQRDVEKWEGVG